MWEGKIKKEMKKIKKYIWNFLKIYYILITTFLSGVFIYGLITGNMENSFKNIIAYLVVLCITSLLKVLRDREKEKNGGH